MTGAITHVSDTARWVAIYRAMESERPDALFRDPYARRLAGPRGEQIVAEIDAMVRELDGGADVAIACRVLPESRYLMSPSFFHYLYTRHLMSRLFNRVVRIALLPGILDTQAGLKAFTARAAELIFPRLTVAGFGFDVELLYIARKHGLRVRQTAVQYRYDDEPSTVRFAADAAAMLRDLARIRWNDWRGRYA